MKTVKIAIGFSRYSDSGLSIKFQHIVASLTGNGHFPNPEPTLAILKQSADEFSASVGAAANRGLHSVANKNSLRSEATEHLNRLALYVQAQAQHNEVVMLSSGFSITGERATVGTLPKPTQFNVKSENQGTVSLKVGPIYGADSYQYEYRLADTDNWTVFVGTKSRALFTGLNSGKPYHFRVAAIGAAPSRTYSDILTSYIL